MREIYLFLCVVFGFGSATAQTGPLSNARARTLVLTDTLQRLDSLTVLPASVRLYDQAQQPIAAEAFQFTDNQIAFIRPRRDTVIATYRVLPYALDAELVYLDSTRATFDETGGIIGLQIDPYAQAGTSVLDFGGLDYNGNFSRGISFGNSQSLVLNSNFNLQMAGQLGDGVEVLAAISDNSIPIQPEGNTQTLREFDKLFIQLSKGRNTLIAGDYELQRPDSYFMNYFKKLQGATVTSEQLLGENQRWRNQGSVAIARGNFARNVINGQEGNQGPYALRGAENERFIIVLAGTERLYIDGVLQVRGIEGDYVIDYNRGDVTFTQNRLITKDSRITVDFEYATQDFTRSLYAVNSDFYSGKKLRAYLNVFSQQDSRTPVDRDLSEAERIALVEAGDDPLNSAISSLRPVDDFDPLRVLYSLRDTVVCGGVDSILTFSNDPETAFFTARFSIVGQGNGRYALDPTIAANGRVYRYVGYDDNCVPLGEYEPIVNLAAPQLQQLYTTGVEYQLNQDGELRAELGLSQKDANRLSELDAQDDVGASAYLGYRQTYDWQTKQNKTWRLATVADYEYRAADFRELNPYRPAEFTRDWNLRPDTARQEQYARAGLDLSLPNRSALSYDYSTFRRQDRYAGNRHAGRYLWRERGYVVDVIGNYLDAASSFEESTFFRPKVTLAVPFARDSTGSRYWQAGVYGERERNDRFAVENGVTADTLSAASFYYDLYRAYVKSPETERYGFVATYGGRLDYAPVGREFVRNTEAREASLQGNWKQGRGSRLSGTITYRELNIDDATLTNQEPQQTYLGRLNYDLNLAGGLVQSNTVYEIGSGQERKLEVAYLEVQDGDGVYQWNDYNGDGIPQQNEFEIAIFQDSARYVRTSIFTDEFVRSDNVTFNQNLRITPRVKWFNAEQGIKKLLAKFSTQSTFLINRKVRDNPGIQSWNPFQLAIPDTSLVSLNATLRQTLFFNRTAADFNAQLDISDNRNRSVLTTGYEARRLREQTLRTRWNFAKQWSLQLDGARGTRSQDSEFFNNKDYAIEFYRAAPVLTYQPSRTFRIEGGYRYEISNNVLPEGTGERALVNDLNLQITYNRSTTTAIRSRVSAVEIDFTGQANTPVGYALLQGLRQGRNYLWTVSIDRQLAKSLQLSLSYEGRKTGDVSAVHTGRAQVAAFF